MWQGLRLKTDIPNPFLGDMFEFFLDDGIKQSEGQFFTPLPICKFIVGALPLAQKIKANPEPLKAVDYACGSGHFLTEYADQIKPLVERQNRDVSDYYSQITGVEKEDRLAKVAKVAAYMHGQEEIKILDTDALAVHPEIQRESFDILVANPPFAVEGFLQTLSDVDKEQYQLIQVTGESSNTNTIQCFFLERIHHLMAPEGVVGVIVPSSILSNTDTVHIRTRELLLQFFDLVGIAELGSGTFGKTGTNTVVLFLRRKAQKPEPAEHYRARVEDFFEGDDESTEYQDEHLIRAYCNHIKVPYEEYIKLFAPTSVEQLGELLQYDIFKDYTQALSHSTEVKNLKKSKGFKEKPETEQAAELAQRLIAYLHTIEKNKLYYFILAHEQENEVLIINAPSTNKERKQFLGYEWSGAKGSEGIQYKGGETVNDIITPLFDPKDLDNSEKINTAIKRNFIGETTDLLPEYCHYTKLADMLDFSRIDFDKAISLTPSQDLDIETQWELVKLGEVVETQYGYTAKAEDEGDIRYLRITDITEDGQLKNTDKKYINPSEKIIKGYTLNPNDIVIARSGSTGRMLLYKDIDERLIFASYLVRLKVSKTVLPEYIFAYHKTTGYWKQVDALTTTLAQPNLNAESMKQIKIPLPPLEVQQQIVDQCETVNKETDQARQTIVVAKQKIAERVQAVINEMYEMKKLEDLMTIIRGASPRPIKNYLTNEKTGINWIKIGDVKEGDKYITKTQEKITKEGAKKSRYVNPNDFILSNSMSFGRPYILKISGCVHDGWLILQNIDEKLDKDFLYLALSNDNVQNEFKNKAGGGVVENLNTDRVKSVKIPVPPLDIQQQLVVEVNQLEEEITQAQAVIDNATKRKNAILTKYLMKIDSQNR